MRFIWFGITFLPYPIIILQSIVCNFQIFYGILHKLDNHGIWIIQSFLYFYNLVLAKQWLKVKIKSLIFQNEQIKQ